MEVDREDLITGTGSLISAIRARAIWLTGIRQITLIVALTFFLCIQVSHINWLAPAIGETRDATVNYIANIYSNGTLIETYTYTLTQQKYRMLYRIWDADVSTTPLSTPYIRPISINSPMGMIPYIKDRSGVVTLPGYTGSDSNLLSTIYSLAERNECGCYSPSPLSPGTYTIIYQWYIYPPLEVDSEAIHLNLLLANSHIPYDSVLITFEDSSYIKILYAHPPSLKITKSDTKIVIEGISGENELLEVELLMDPSLTQWDGVKTLVAHVMEKTENANWLYSLQHSAVRVKIIEGGVTNPTSKPGNMEGVWFKAVYEYDNRFPIYEEFTGEKGTIYVNNHAMTWSSFDNIWKYNTKLDDIGNLIFEVSKVEDRKYGSVQFLDIVGPQVITWKKSFLETPMGIALVTAVLAMMAVGFMFFLKRRK